MIGILEDEDDDEHEDEDPNFGVWVKSSQEVRSNPRASARERFEKKLCSAANAKFHRRSQESELRSQELQNMRARSLSENPGQASARENLRRNPRFLAPELLNSEFWNVESGTPSSFREVHKRGASA